MRLISLFDSSSMSSKLMCSLPWTKLWFMRLIIWAKLYWYCFWFMWPIIYDWFMRLILRLWEGETTMMVRGGGRAWILFLRKKKKKKKIGVVLFLIKQVFSLELLTLAHNFTIATCHTLMKWKGINGGLLNGAKSDSFLILSNFVSTDLCKNNLNKKNRKDFKMTLFLNSSPTS